MYKTRVVDGKTYKLIRLPYAGPDLDARKPVISSKNARRRAAIKRNQRRPGRTPG